MLRYFAVFFLGVLLSSCNINKKKEQKPSGYLSLANADSLFTDFEKESDSTIKLKKGLVLDSLLFKNKVLGKWAITKIQLADLFYDKLNNEKESANQFKILAETTVEDAGDSLFNVSLCKAYVMHAYNLRNINSQYFTVIQYCQKYLLNLYHRYIDKGYLGAVYKYLGSSLTRIGDRKSAMTYMFLAYNTNVEAKDFESAAGNCTDIAINFKESGNLDSALHYIEKGLSFKVDYKDRKAALYITQADCLLALSRYEEAKKSIDDVYRIKITNPEILSSIYVSDARLNLRTGHLPAALQLYEKAAHEKYKADSTYRLREYGKIFIESGDCFLKENNLYSAIHYYHKALWTVTRVDTSDVFSLPARDQLYPENTILEALDAKAGAFQLLYQQKPDAKYLTTAIQCYTLSFEVEKKLMQYFSYDESKLLMLNESRQRSQKAINLCYQLYQLTKDNQWAQKAFEFAEKNKAFVLLESVKRNLASNAALQNDTLYQNTQKLQLQLAYTERSLAEATTDSAKQKLQQQKTKLENDLLFANTALGRQSIAYKTVMEKEDSISAATVSADLLNEHTGLIEFFNADSVTYAFVLNKKQPIQFIRYNANLSSAIDSTLYFFKTASAISNQPLAYQKAAYNLYKTLQFEQMDKGWQNLIIIPDGKLSFVPFDALITNASFTVNLQQANYFINQCNTLYGYSAAILLKQLHNNTSQINSTSIFAPVFSNSENQQQPLLYSLQEAEAIGTNKNTTSFVKEKATLGNFKQQFTNSGILHIATHAYADTGINSNPKIEFIDSSLLLNELYAMHTNASLVVLSACETGLGRLNSSEGPMSLARGFYYAGAKNVITSYWNVDDKSTATLFTSVYKNMESSSSTNAIYQAKKELIKNENGKFASPYYWAGFVHIGMPQKKESQSYWWALLLFPLAIAVYYWVKPKPQPTVSTTPTP